MISKIRAFLTSIASLPLLLVIPLVAALALLFRRKRPSLVPPISLNPSVDSIRAKLDTSAEQSAKKAAEHQARASVRLSEADAESARVHELSDADLLDASTEYAARVRKRPPNLIVLLLALTLSASTARAEPMPELMAHPTSKAPGFWLPSDVWRHALSDALKLEHAEAAIRELENASWFRERQVDELRAAMAIERAQTDVLSVQLAQAQADLTAAHRWYRSPRFLVPLGLFVGVSVGAFVGVRAAQ